MIKSFIRSARGYRGCGEFFNFGFYFLWGFVGFFVRGVTILMEVRGVELDLKNENAHKINLKKLK